MSIKADDITRIIREQLGSFSLDVDVAEVGAVVSVGDGIARVQGVDKAMSGEMLEFPQRPVRHRAEPRRGQRRRRVARRVRRAFKEGDQVKRTGRIISVPVGDATARPRGQLARPAGRRQGPDRDRPVLAHRAAGAGRHRSAARCNEPLQTGIKAIDAMIADRPGPARADHRRPPDGQDRRRASTRSSTRRARTSSASTTRSDRSTRSGVVLSLPASAQRTNLLISN